MKNADLLDDSVSNSDSLKNQRINRIAKTAINPNPKVEMKQELPIENEDDGNDNEQYQTEREDYVRTQPTASSNTRNPKKSVDSNSDEKKILGMKPMMFYTILGAVAIIGGIYLYKKYGKKGKGKFGVDASAGATPTSTATPPIPDIKI